MTHEDASVLPAAVVDYRVTTLRVHITAALALGNHRRFSRPTLNSEEIPRREQGIHNKAMIATILLMISGTLTQGRV